MQASKRCEVVYIVGSHFYSLYLLFSVLPLRPLIHFLSPSRSPSPSPLPHPTLPPALPSLPLFLLLSPRLSPLLLQHQILYNRAYVLCHKGRNAEAREELEKAKQIAAGASESRQRIVNAALENMKVVFVFLQLFS